MNTKDHLRRQWAEFAETYISRTAAGDNVYRDGLLDKWMLEAVGDVAGKRVIDLGCGEGRFCRMLAERGAVITGIDLCERFIEHAEAHRINDEQYHVADMENLSRFPDGGFDMAVSFVSLVDIMHLEKAVTEAYRLLRTRGRFIACNLQPMSTAGNSWLRDADGRQIHFILDNYFDESERIVKMFGKQMTNFHRTLGTYVNCFLAAGFALEGIREPRPSPEQVANWPDVADNLRLPYFIIYLLRKRT